MKKYTKILIIVLITLISCKSNDVFIVKKYPNTVEDPLRVKALLKYNAYAIDSTFLHIVKVKKINHFKLTNKLGNIILDKQLENIKGTAIPYAFIKLLDNSMTYNLYIDNKLHIITRRNLKKYKYIDVKYNYHIKKYEIKYTNQPQKYE